MAVVRARGYIDLPVVKDLIHGNRNDLLVRKAVFFWVELPAFFP